MLTGKYRPLTFDQVIAQDQAVKLLKAVSKNRDNVCRSILMYGPWGTGKVYLS